MIAPQKISVDPNSAVFFSTMRADRDGISIELVNIMNPIISAIQPRSMMLNLNCLII